MLPLSGDARGRIGNGERVTRSTVGSRRVRLLGRLAVGVLSVGVLFASALGWIELRALDRSTPQAAVIDTARPSSTGEQNILLVGLDSRTDAQGHPLPEDLLAELHAGEASSGG